MGRKITCYASYGLIVHMEINSASARRFSKIILMQEKIVIVDEIESLSSLVTKPECHIMFKLTNTASKILTCYNHIIDLEGPYSSYLPTPPADPSPSPCVHHFHHPGSLFWLGEADRFRMREPINDMKGCKKCDPTPLVNS